MGNDGGSIAKRRDLARSKKKARRLDKTSKRSIQATTCCISSEPLQTPVMSCRLGNMYNKESILEALHSKSKKLRSFPHLKSLKDLKEIKLTPAAAHSAVPFLCPITGQEMDGTHGFLFNWGCGCVVSEKAVMELPGKECLLCSAPVTEMISLNQSEEEQRKRKREVSRSEAGEEEKGEEVVKRAKLVDGEMLEKMHKDKLETDERKR